LVASAGVLWGAFAVALRATAGHPLHVAATVLSILAGLRAALFLHELAHGRPGGSAFSLAWHLLVGLPLLIPSLLYVGPHADHHRAETYGTEFDPEYAPIANWSRPRLLRFTLAAALVPAVLWVRWALLGPLSLLLPRFRRAVVERASTLALNRDYRRASPVGAERWRWWWQEIAYALFCWLAFAGWWRGMLANAVVMQWLWVSSGLWMLNQLRVLIAHGYHHDGEQVDATGQMLDSIDLVGGSVVAALLAPVGLRYHALHHVEPMLAYHRLSEFREELCAELPANALYLSCERNGVRSALADLWRGRPPHEVPRARPDSAEEPTNEAAGEARSARSRASRISVDAGAGAPWA
jgi:fatty acid desaturase